MTQQDLAGDDYSKSYISAIEQGKTRPSLEALQRISSRLEVPAGTLLDPDAPGFVPPDPEALPRRVRRRRGGKGGAGGGASEASQVELRVTEAELLTFTGRGNEALTTLKELLAQESPEVDTSGSGGLARRLAAAQTARVLYLATQAALQADQAQEAVGYAQEGVRLASRMGEREMLEQMRNLLGVAYYSAGQHLSALEQHRLCIEAIQAGVTHDPNFKLQVYNNIARDYAALHDTQRAAENYKAALELMDGGNGNSPQTEAANFWEISKAQVQAGNYEAAQESATKAAGIYEALDNIQTVARMQNSYGTMLIEMEKYQDAEGYLRSSLQLAESLNSNVDKAIALTNLARLSVSRGNPEEAALRTQQAIEMSRAALRANKQAAGAGPSSQGAQSNKGTAQGKKAQSKGDANRVLAGALALGGEIADSRKDQDTSDQMFEEAIKLIESQGATDMSSDIYQRYAQVLASRGNHEQASRYYERAYKAVTKKGR